jgi:hypothetical protein
MKSKRKRSFVRLSRTKRSAAGFKLRQRIERDRDLYGGHFTSQALLIEPEEPIICNQWFDFVFPGLHKYEIWNAVIMTAREAFWGEVQSRAFDRAHALLSPEECEKEFKMDSVPSKWDSMGKVLTYTLLPKTPIQYPQFDGHTFRDYCLQAEREIIVGEAPEIYESFRLDRSYRYGVGLFIVVDAEAISYSLIDQTIDRFLKLGQTAWKSGKPVLRERLPFEIEADALKGGRALFSSLPLRERNSYAADDE